MKKFNEWQEETTKEENPDILISTITDLTTQLELALKNFHGERFEGFINLLGSVKGLQRTLAEINHNVVGDTPQFTTAE